VQQRLSDTELRANPRLLIQRSSESFTGSAVIDRDLGTIRLVLGLAALLALLGVLVANGAWGPVDPVLPPPIYKHRNLQGDK
jgi:hypothetical protein